MKSNKTKIAINKALDNLSDELLERVLSYVKNIENMNKESISMKNHLENIIKKDDELLKKLSQ